MNVGVVAVLLGLTGCGDDVSACVSGADCPSGMCGADGQCIPVEGTSSGSDEGSGSTGAASSAESSTTADSDSASSGADESTSTGGGSADCMPPNGDGVIERTELFFDPELQVNFLAAQAVTFDTAGTTIDGETVWDMSVDFPGDHTSSGEYLSVEGQWFEPSFPSASYATRLTDADDLLGVFEVTDSALTLLGVVSPVDGLQRTELVYDPPVTVLSFPLVQGKSWESDSTVTGVALGVPSAYTESYENRIDASGVLRTAFGDYDVLRVGVVLTRTIGIVPTVLRSYAYVSECVGTVGNVRSNDNEDSVEFTQVAELRRIDP